MDYLLIPLLLTSILVWLAWPKIAAFTKTNMVMSNISISNADDDDNTNLKSIAALLVVVERLKEVGATEAEITAVLNMSGRLLQGKKDAT